MSMTSTSRPRVWKRRLAALLSLLVIGSFLAAPAATQAQSDGPNPAGAPIQIFLPAVAAPDFVSSWKITRVDAPRYFLDMTGRSMALRDAGQPCVAYGADHLYYACFNGSVWKTQVVDSTDSVGRYASLAFDANKIPHIAYYDEGRGALKYAYDSANGWVIQTLDKAAAVSQADEQPEDWERQALDSDSLHAPAAPAVVISGKGGVGGYTSIAVDSSGRPHIAYYNFDTGDLRYVSGSGGTWVRSTLDATGNVGQYASLGLYENQPRVAYYDATNGDLKYTAANAGEWQAPRVLDGAGDVGQYASLGITKNGGVRVAYYDASNGDLKLASVDGSAITAKTLDNSAARTGLFASLYVQPNSQEGTLHISYYDETNGSLLYYSTNTGKPMPVRKPNPIRQEIVGRYSAIAVDGNNVYFTYYHSNLGMLFGDIWAGEGYLGNDPQYIDTSKNVGLDTSIALDADGQPHITYLNDINDSLLYAARLDGAWTWETVQEEEDTGHDSALVIDANGLPHVAYWNGIIEVPSLWYAERSNLDPSDGSYDWLHRAWVDGDSEEERVGFNPSLAIDSQNREVISYWDESNNKGQLMLARATSLNVDRFQEDKPDDTFYEKIVLDKGSVGAYSSLAIGKDGAMHIAYYDYGNKDLKYIRYTGGTPGPVVVDGGPDEVGKYASLALDSAGQPWIAYLDDTHDALKLAHYTGTKWEISVVDDSGAVGAFASLELDAKGRPHVAYYDLANYDLKYAYQDSAGWHIQVVDSDGDVGRSCSLALNQAGKPRISYYDVSSGDLKLAEGE